MLAAIRWLVLAAAAAGMLVPANAQTATAVEYRHVACEHYFITASPAEAAYLDAGAFGGAWTRTGQTFAVYAQSGPGVFPTCRFFTTTYAPKGSHFYTPDAAECEYVKTNPNWQYESIAFNLALPDASGACAAGTTTLYRLFNNGLSGAPNHRYTTSKAVFDQMQAKGWAPEGHPVTHAFACVPPSPAQESAEGMWVGQTTGGQFVRGYVLADGTYWLLVKPSAADDPIYVFQGTVDASGGTFASSDGKEYPVADSGLASRFSRPAAVVGTYVPRTSLQLTITATETYTLTAAYDASYEQPASLAAVAGVYAGHTGHGNGGLSTTFTVVNTGALGGSNTACSYSGSVTPHGAVNLYDFTLTGNLGACPWGTGNTITGQAFYDAATHRFLAFAPFEGRGDCYHVIGSKP